MQSRSQRTLEKWRKRIADLISTESAKIIVASIPELREILGVDLESSDGATSLTSAEAVTRLKSVLGSMFQTFAMKNKVCPFRLYLTFGSLVSLPWMTCSGPRWTPYPSYLTIGDGAQLFS